ncbi:PAS-domain containing protein [Yoonia vestfoldensis]|uniref:PAS-domain containing protein n=1 Tax=Yoonia vestfoldensis TaxID=245188 RepID=UPI00035C6340|nr:PAS-domain containing protein [Yoonia vestfoldensis]
MSLILLTIAAMAIAAGLGATLATQWRRKSADAPRDQAHPPPSGPVFLFHGDDLIDTTPDAQQLIAPFSLMPDRDAMIHVLDPQFPGLAAYFESAAQKPCRIVHRHHESVWIDVDWPNGQLRVAVGGTWPDDAASTPGQFAASQQTAELAMLRDVLRHAPHLIWRTDVEGKLIWANQAYLDFWGRLDPDKQNVIAGKTFCTADAVIPAMRRIAVPMPKTGAEHWFDVVTVCQGTSRLHFATDANATVRADQERRNFVQTLGKTFAELSIGLAIFDKRRQLATFNPALLDMTRLGFEFLSTRPTIDTVLDRLRETRILPEPKNYASWRDQFTAVETAAKNGTYSEVWNLPDGQAFRVTGRPHPDGAFAFLFEDITAELSLTRRFRSDIETGQAVLDALPDAIAVFTTAGTLVMYNRAYASLWDMPTDLGLEHRAFAAEMAVWHTCCTAATDWTDLQHFIHQPGPRTPWSDDALLADGRMLRCQATPISGGMTMVRFTLAPRNLPVLRKLAQNDPAIRAVKR